MITYLVVAGLVNWLATLILVEGKIFQPVRSRVTGEYARYFVACHLCTGTWVGLVMAAWLTLLAPYALPFAGWWMVLVNGLAIKAVGHLIYVAHQLGDAKIEQGRAEAKIFAPVPVPGVDEEKVS